MKILFGWCGVGLDLAYYDGPLAYLRVGFLCLDFCNTRLAWWLTMGRWERKHIHPPNERKEAP